MNIEEKPGPVFGVRAGWPVQKDHFALVPALVGLADVGQVEGSLSERRIWTDTRHSLLVPHTHMRGVQVVPDVDWNVAIL